MSENNNETMQESVNTNMKFCKHCGEKIPADAVICMKCGRQVEQIAQAAQPQIVINNANTNSNVNNLSAGGGRAKNKWVAFCLCLVLGVFGAHRFYEGRIGSGILYLFTFGLCGIGAFIDLIALLFKPNPYYV